MGRGVKIGGSRGPKWRLDPLWAIFGHFEPRGALLAFFDPFWPFGAIWGYFDLFLAHVVRGTPVSFGGLLKTKLFTGGSISQNSFEYCLVSENTLI